MSIDLTKGLCIKIEGEIGKFQSLPIETLIKIGQSLQDLINNIARYDISSNQGIDLNNFKIELTGFGKSSAIPEFAFTKRIQPTINDYTKQRKTVNNKLGELFAVSDKGDYFEIKDIYPDNYKRNIIVENYYSFMNSFNQSPVSIVTSINGEKSETVYRFNRFKKATKDKLITDIKDSKPEALHEIGYGKVKRTIKDGIVERSRVVEYYQPNEAILSHSPEIINLPDKQYILSSPLLCKFEKEDDYYIIKNEMIDIIGTGLTIDDAEANFNEEFDYIYKRYNSLPNKKLSDRLIKIKKILNLIVEKIEIINGINK